MERGPVPEKTRKAQRKEVMIRNRLGLAGPEPVTWRKSQYSAILIILHCFYNKFNLYVSL